MIRELSSRLIEGLLSPRASARRVLDAQYGADVAVMFAVLAYCLQAILQILIPGARGAGGIPLGAHIFNMVAQIALVGLLSLAIYGIGRLFGGAGTRRQAFVIVAWHALVTTLLAPLFLIGFAQQSDGQLPLGALAVLVVAGAQYLWVLACYTMELHGFRSPWGVMGAMIAVSFLFSGLVMSFQPTP